MKASTEHTYEARILRVQNYIQEHLDEPLSLETLAAVACFSPYHFHRIFKGMTGESVKAYLRRLKLERAASQLKLTDRRVGDIAFEAAYENIESFSRAFSRLFQRSPLAFRKARKTAIARKLEVLPPPEVTLLDHPAQTVAYVRHQGPYHKVERAWHQLMDWVEKTKGLGLSQPMFGLPYDDPEVTPAKKLRYDACVALPQSMVAERTPVGGRSPVFVQRVPGGTYACLLHRGPYRTIERTYLALMAGWLPGSGFEASHRPVREVYLNDPQTTAPADLLTEIHLCLHASAPA